MTGSHPGRRAVRRALSRIAADPHVLLAIAVVLAALVIELAAGADALPIVVPAIVLLTVQLVVALRAAPGRSVPLDTGRLVLTLAIVSWMSLRTGGLGTLPLTSLFIPIVAMSAALGLRPALVVSALALAGYLAPVLSAPVIAPELLHRGVALVATMILITIGTRQTMSKMERAVRHARRAMDGQRRRGRQMAAVEAVGRALAAHGPTQATLDEVMDLLVARFGYRYVSIYTGDSLMRLGAQRGYDTVIQTFDGTVGVVGRVMRTGRAELVKDVSTDRDYRSASPNVRSEVSVPLGVDGRLLGVLNVESAEAPLDESDRDTLVLIGDRVATALALASERQALRDRADQFARLVAFGTTISASLERLDARGQIVAAAAEVFEAEIVVLVQRDPTTGDDRIAAMHGGDARYLGARIPPGEGASGRAMEERGLVQDAVLSRDAMPSTTRGARVPDRLSTAAYPLLHDDRVIGALSIGRIDLERPFSGLEIETLPLVAAQISVALRNIELHAQVADAAIRDPLTGLWNRRHLDVSLARLFATRARMEPTMRHAVAAVLFDLDDFGAFNKQHGHATGDAVLRAFGGILARRLRSSDIVARFGGEEFVAILDGASIDEAWRVADEIRRELEAVRFPGSDGGSLRATVSAGCAQLGPAVASLDTLLEVADVALQMAKRGGRNQVVAA